MVNSLPSAFLTLKERTPKSLISVGLSMKYWKFGAVKVKGSSVGNNCVATFQAVPFGWTNVTRTGRMSKPRAHMNVAGMFMCAWVLSIPR